MAEKDEPLTERELEVVRLVATGITNKEIAGKLYLSPSTVKVHLANIFTKLDVHSRTELTMLAVRSGWVEGATETFTPDVAPLPLLQTTVQPVVAAVTERTVFVRVPLKVAPNPAPLPALPLWRKIALGVCGLITLLGLTVPGLQARNNAGDAGDPELAPRTGELLPGENTRWAQRAPMRAARARANAVAAGGQVYVIGGDSNGGPSAEVAVFLPRSNTWRNAAAKPTAVRNAASASLNGLIYVSGGQRDANTSANVVEVFDPGSGEWRANAPALPRALSGHIMAALNGRLYVFGGRALDGLNNQGYMFDPSAQSWTAVAGLPTPRSFAAAATSRGKLYVVGGFDNARESALCEVFDPATITCRTGGGSCEVDQKSGRCGHGAWRDTV